jgi:spore maturation protein CgeB
MGNAHFLRGVLSECWHRGFDVLALEPANSWSAQNLSKDHGRPPRKAGTRPTRRCRS